MRDKNQKVVGHGKKVMGKTLGRHRNSGHYGGSCQSLTTTHPQHYKGSLSIP